MKPMKPYSVRLPVAVLLLLLSARQLVESALDFDLNQTIEDDPGQVEEQQQQQFQLHVKPGSRATRATQGRSEREIHERRQRAREFLKKIQDLFGILKVCDSENFDLNSIQAPDSFHVEKAAMMALSAVANSKMILNRDKPRYNRIMKNCSRLAEKVQKKEESQMSNESQMSGGSHEDTMERLKNSPFDSIKERFFSGLKRAAKSSSKLIKPNANSIADINRPVAQGRSVGANGLISFI